MMNHSSLQGTFENGVHRLALRVYYEDTDFSGLVYHANYLKFCERARSDLIRILGVDQTAMFGGEDALAIVIRRMVCEFLKPARFDEVLAVETTPTESSGVRLNMMQRVLRGEDVLFTAEVMAVMIDKSGRPKRVPAHIAQRLGLK